MKNKLFLFLIIVVNLTYSQSKEKLNIVIRNTNVKELQVLKNDLSFQNSQREERIINYLLKNPNVKRVVHDGFNIKEIYDVSLSGEVSYYNTSNFNSSRTVHADKLYDGGLLGLNVQGQGMRAVVWDGGNARKTHVEFPNNKVINIDGNVYEDHATHVTGTIVAKGITQNLRGIAFDAVANTYNWNDDYTEMAYEASLGLLVSNHSYWIGSSFNTWSLGSYDTRASQFDQIAFLAPYYLAVTAAGNDRNDFSDDVIGPYLVSKGGYNLCRGMQNAKNYLTIGAVYQVTNYTSPSSVLMSDFSSWGPTDDGRIKPDVVAKGVSVRSTLASSNTAQGIQQGTSMASPAVAGVALLLQQHYENLNLNYMRAATLKGLINHTADECGDNEGPDYRFGWGLVNAEAAAQIITGKGLNTAVIEENILNNNATYTKTITSSGTTPLMVSISWTDKQATANTGTVDPTNSNLINDLDIRVTKDGVTYYPWTLNPAVPTDGAVRTGDNFRDNFEKIQIDNPNGTYTVTVTHKGTLNASLQNYSLIVSGPQINLDAEQFVANKSSINVFPNPTSNVLNFDASDFTQISQVQIIDLSGKIINTNFNLNQKSIDVSNLQTGVYFIKFTTDRGIITKKFIKK